MMVLVEGNEWTVCEGKNWGMRVLEDRDVNKYSLLYTVHTYAQMFQWR